MGKPARRCRPQPRGGRSVPRRGSGSGSERCRPAAAGAEARPRSQRRCKRAPSFHKAQIIGAEPSGSGKPPPRPPGTATRAMRSDAASRRSPAPVPPARSDAAPAAAPSRSPGRRQSGERTRAEPRGCSLLRRRRAAAAPRLPARLLEPAVPGCCSRPAGSSAGSCAGCSAPAG